jgi:hypothetical protein
VAAPFAVKVAELPLQTKPLLAVMVGKLLTVTEVVPVFTQPLASVPVIV